MKRAQYLYSILLKLVRKHTYGSLAIALLVLALIGGLSFALVEQSSHKNQHATAGPLDTTADPKNAQETDAESAPAATTTSTGQQPTTANSSPKTPPTSSQKTLKISPSSFTAKPGEELSVTIQASDGKAINMPMFGTRTDGKFLMNFAAGPAKTSWSGQIITIPSVTPGTYKLEVVAQDNSAAYYRSNITITIVKPTMNITIQSLGYDDQDDTLNYLIKINRLFGFSEAITEVEAYSATEPGLGCFYDIVDTDTISLACDHEDPDEGRPTSGTLTVSVGTATLVRSSTVSYVFPPL